MSMVDMFYLFFTFILHENMYKLCGQSCRRKFMDHCILEKKQGNVHSCSSLITKYVKV